MLLTPIQTIIMIFAIAIGTMLTRFTPFILFPENKKQPKIVRELSKLLPAAMMGLLVVYCLKGVTLLSFPYGIPEAIAIAFLCLLHHFKHNVLLSIAGSTLCYMILVQMVFV